MSSEVDLTSLIKFAVTVEACVKIADDGLYFIFSFHSILFSFSFSFKFSIFRTTWVRGYQSRCYISHNLMA